MEYVVVNFDETRDVYIDDQKNGETNKTVRVGAGTHTFRLGDPQDLYVVRPFGTVKSIF